MSLKRLERRGFIVMKEKLAVSGSPPVKLYAATAKGKEARAIAGAEADALHRAVHGTKGGK
jgi:DNA-binding PadR family transcriptional regulator